MKIKQRTGETTWHEASIDDDGVVALQNFEKVDGILKENAFLRSQPPSFLTCDMGRKMARIPLTLYNELRNKGIINDHKAFRRWLNDPANSKWRTTGGKL